MIPGRSKDFTLERKDGDSSCSVMSSRSEDFTLERILQAASTNVFSVCGFWLAGLGMANPYAIIKCGGQVQRSATAQSMI